VADMGIRIDWHSHLGGQHAYRYAAEWRAMSKHQKTHAPSDEGNE
jgi:hypothetical protein